MNYCYYLLLCLVVIFYRTFSSTCLAPMQIYWNKRKRVHKKRVQLLHDWFGTRNTANYSKSNTCVVEKWPEADHCFVFPYERVVWYLYLGLLSMRKLLSWLVPRRLSIDVNLRAKEGGKEKTGETLPPLLSRPFPWSLALCHQSLVFRARLCSRQKCGKRSAPSG